jgi:hypothetical protein
MGPQKRADCNEVVEKLTAFYSACSSDRQYCIQRIRLPPRHLTNSGSDLSLLSPAPLDFTPETDKLIRRKSLHGYAGPMETDSSITDTGSFATDLVATSSRNDTLPDAVPPEPARMDTVIESLHISQPESPPPRKVHFPPSRSRPGSIQDFQISAEDNEQMEIPESTEMPPRPIVPATSMLSLPSSSTSEPSQMMAPKPSSRSYDVEPQSSQQESSPSEPQVKGPEPSPSRSGDVELQSSQSSQILQQEPPAQSKSLRKRLQRLFRNRRYLD